LSKFTVYPCAEHDVHRIAEIILGNEVGTRGTESVHAFSLEGLFVNSLAVAGRRVVGDSVAEYVRVYLFGRDVFPGAADD
jgi:hypothetical protein